MNAQDYLPALGRISLQAGVLVLLVLLAQRIFRRQLTARWRCALWMLVIVRLLLPFSPGSAASIFNLMPPLANHAVHSAPTSFAPAAAAPAPLPVVANPTLETPELATQPAPPPENARALTPVPEPMQAPLSPPDTSAAPTAVKLPPVTATSWLATLFWVWLAGALLLTGYIVATSLRLAWRCRGLPALTNAATLAVLDECGRRLGVRGRLTVVECAEVASPALFGLFRPRLLLPPGFTRSFSPSELRFVFLHELAHLRRWDLPLNWLVAVLQILHWFNPLVWFGFARWRLDRELACDALAIEAAGADQHREYGRTILHLLENLTPRAPMPGLVGILEDKRQLRRRIGMIANFRPGNRWGLPSVALLLVLALVGLTDAQSPKTPRRAPPTSLDPHQTEPKTLSWSAATNEANLGAPGYEPLTTESMDSNLGDQGLEPLLRHSADTNELTVLQPDGKPAAGAKLWARTTPDGGCLFIDAPGRYYGDRLAKEQTGEDGRIKLPGGLADAPVVIAHTNGFLDTTVAELKRTGEARLRAYGAVEGRLLVAGKPKRGANVTLSTLAWSPSLGFHLAYTVTTDSEGRFWFTQVPTGEFKLYRWAATKTPRSGPRTITETYQMPVTINAGQTNIVEYASMGRAVIGQALPEPGDASVNWQNDAHTLSLKLPDASPRGRPNREDYATFEAFRKANDASFRSETQAQQARQARAYGLEIENDGSFRIEDVPPGNYELRIRVTKPDESQQRNPFGNEQELGSLVRDIVVSEGKEPLDLGTLRVAMKGVATAKSSPPVELTALTLDGKPLSLAQFKGKHVLLVFWASWSERSREQLVELQKLQKEFASDSRLVFVGVSLDETAEAALKAVDSGGYQWTQGWLEAQGRAKLTAALDVNTLPTVFLFDADGRIVARELEGERLQLTVKRVLAKQ